MSVETFKPVPRYKEQWISFDPDMKRFYGLSDWDEKLRANLFMLAGILGSLVILVPFFTMFGKTVNEFFGTVIGFAVIAAGLYVAYRYGDKYFDRKKKERYAYRTEYASTITERLQAKGWEIDDFISDGILNESPMQVKYKDGLEYISRDVMFMQDRLRITFMLVSDVFVKTKDDVDPEAAAIADSWKDERPRDAFLAGVEWAKQNKG